MTEVVDSTWHWRNTMKTVRFFKFDARAGLFVIVVLVHMRIWTFGALILVLMLFSLLERKGLSFPAAIRALRAWLVGVYRPAFVYTRRRKFLDTGSC